ncbi:ferric reductase-like transmembrane domain-containing protein [Allobranchiibius huperziae]|uniref:Putative ferric reductase n=1 Tax=Allobranchiibius huperziae TaxID=1874116 RepID=A0A853DFV7_9MICO|nr:putative ferric reductase [Allobranchiibius huperziae]
MNETLWYVSRATGALSIVLMTVVMILGLVLSGARQRAGERTTVIQGVHRSLALGMLTFLVLHIATAVAETYVHIDLISALVPFTSPYRRFLVGLGTLSVDVLAAVMATSLLRHRISQRVWRVVHRSTFATWPLTLWHGIAMGTSNEPLLRGTTIACAVAGGIVVIWRIAGSHHDSARRREVLRQEWT